MHHARSFILLSHDGSCVSTWYMDHARSFVIFHGEVLGYVRHTLQDLE